MILIQKAMKKSKKYQLLSNLSNLFLFIYSHIIIKNLSQRKKRKEKRKKLSTDTSLHLSTHLEHRQTGGGARDEAGVKWRPGQQRSTSSTACVTPLGGISSAKERKGERGEEAARDREGGWRDGRGERACSADWYQWRQIELAGDRWSSPAVTPSYGSVHNVFPSFSSRVSSATIQPSRRLFLQRHSFENISRACPPPSIAPSISQLVNLHVRRTNRSFGSENSLIFRLSSLSPPPETIESLARFTFREQILIQRCGC